MALTLLSTIANMLTHPTRFIRATVTRVLLTCGVVAMALWTAAPARAVMVTYQFEAITNNSLADVAIVESQLFMDVEDYGAWGGFNHVLFTFRNEGPFASSITDIYFDDGVLLSVASFLPSPGVSFSLAASPRNLPGAEPYDFRPEYNGIPNKYFAMDSNSATYANGINPGESLGIVYTLQAGKTYDDVIDGITLAMTDRYHDIPGGLRVGIHVQGFEDGGSESAMLPDPGSTVALLGLALLGIEGVRRRLA